MPTWRKSPPELVTRFDELAALVPGAVRKQMFGYPCCILGGNMFMSLHEDPLVLRLGAEARAGLLATIGGEPFAPMPGRPIREHVAVPAAVAHTQVVEPWVRRAHAFARTLKPK